MASSETAVSCPPSAWQGRPLPSRCARHPPPERGWAGNMEERTAPLSLASHRLRGEGDHEVVEGGGLQWRPVPAKRAIKLIARRAIPPPFEPACQRQAELSEPSEPGHQRRRTFTPQRAVHKGTRLPSDNALRAMSIKSALRIYLSMSYVMIGILQWEPYNRAWGARKCTPIPACGGTSPGGGSLLCACLTANLSSSTHSGE